jgi:hypothetical protein
MPENTPTEAPQAQANPGAAPPVVPDPAPKKAAAKKAATKPKGLHDGTAREAKLDPSYVERPYSEAMTKDQREALKDAGLL